MQECGSTSKRLMSTLPGLSMGEEKLLCLVFGENILPQKVFLLLLGFCCLWWLGPLRADCHRCCSVVLLKLLKLMHVRRAYLLLGIETQGSRSQMLPGE